MAIMEEGEKRSCDTVFARLCDLDQGGESIGGGRIHTHIGPAPDTSRHARRYSCRESRRLLYFPFILQRRESGLLQRRLQLPNESPPHRPMEGVVDSAQNRTLYGEPREQMHMRKR